MTTQVRGYVFVDARLPFPGQTRYTAPPELVTQLSEMAGPDGWLPRPPALAAPAAPVIGDRQGSTGL